MTTSVEDFKNYCQGTLLQQFADLLREHQLKAGVYHATNDTLRNALSSDFGVLQPIPAGEVSAALKKALDDNLTVVLPAAQTEDGTDPAAWPLRFTLGLGVSIDGRSMVSLQINGQDFSHELATPASSSAVPAAGPDSAAA